MREVWVDVGGTFTDCLLPTAAGLRSVKLLSSGRLPGRAASGGAGWLEDPARAEAPDGLFRGWRLEAAGGSAVVGEHVGRRLSWEGALAVEGRYLLVAPEPTPLVGARWLLGLAGDAPTGPLRLRLGTTRGTNALLERAGARTAVALTAGLEDGLVIGDQTRADLFAMTVRREPSLAERVVSVPERLAADGAVLAPLDRELALTGLRAAREAGCESLAIALLHAHIDDRHERELAELAREAGFEHVTCSSALSATEGLVGRGQTAEVDAYLSPVVQGYVAELRAAAPEIELLLMTSAGALADAPRFRGKDSLLSGPAGGVVGVAAAARATGRAAVIGFDMGGTSTDVCRWAGDYARRYEQRIGAARVRAPALAIETVAAGGGSIIHVAGGVPVVGPRSAGSDPGPACYGLGGEALTVTDVNVLAGRLPAARFPFPLDADAAHAALGRLIDALEAASGARPDPEALLPGLLAIVDQQMAAAVERVTLAAGHDAREHSLVAFGGAGAMHACGVASALGVREVIVPPQAGLLSALGIGCAALRRFADWHLGCPLDEAALVAARAEAARRAPALAAELAAAGLAAAPAQRLGLELRYDGQSAALVVEAEGDVAALRGAFEAEHRRRYGFALERPLELVSARLELAGEERSVAHGAPDDRDSPVAADEGLRALAWAAIDEAPEPGPCLVLDATATLVVEAGWEVARHASGALIVSDRRPAREQALGDPARDPVALQLIAGRLTRVAEVMGEALARTAISVNVRDRLDFSCALFDGAGDLVVNAPHIPAHLGAMADAVKAAVALHGAPPRGQALVTNNPYRGGSHLPDVTLITPVYLAEDAEPAFFLASRAHHAEIGGSRPGSFPPEATTLGEEGVLLDGLRVEASGDPDAPGWRALSAALAGGRWPSRAVETNLADLRAQLAAGHAGSRRLQTLVAAQGRERVAAGCRALRELARREVLRALRELPELGPRRFADATDDGTPIAVAVDLAADPPRFDFGGSGPAHAGNLNAPRAITASALVYVLRCLIGRPLPLNQGVLDAVELIVPPGLLDPPAAAAPSCSPAVAGGNVETSQRVVDVLLGALGLAAASQGTMNNLLFGDEGFGYYETIGGGSGATAAGPGADAIHCHMTNTRLTDPEVLEARYPVRLLRWRIRQGSGGAGQHRGGDGMLRELEFLRPLVLTLLTQRRLTAPYGLAGGQPGAPGRNTLIRPTGEHDLGPIAAVEVQPGDRLRVETPGGGGWGSPGL